MDTFAEQDHPDLRRAYAALQDAHRALVDSARELERAGWTVSADVQRQAASLVLHQLDAIESFAVGVGWNL